jgi:hypothetical protein
MDPVQVALVTLSALVVGMLIPIMIQIWLTLRQVQQELHATQAKLDPLLEDVRTALQSVRSATQMASAISLAVTAGIHAWRETRGTTTSAQDTP